MSGSQDDPLSSYRQKRDPGVTNEPFGVVRHASEPALDGETWTGDFVVHLHAATRRHYDLRMQIGGSLLSFAVPRGPSLNVDDKRLAVQTENHPLEYLDFEDVIPDENYGAGPMIVWDIGRVRYLEHAAERGLPVGKLDFELFGHKLRGRFALVETTARVSPKPKQRQWLLLKKADTHSTTDPVPIVEQLPQSVFSGLLVEQLGERAELANALLDEARALGARSLGPQGATETGRWAPMLCANEGAELVDAARLYELKLDGVRIIVERRAEEVRLSYRTGRSATLNYPEVVRGMQLLFCPDFVMDGEIVSFDSHGKPNFQRLAGRIQARRPHDIKRARAEVPVVFLAFDLLRIGDLDLRHLPLSDRKGLLQKLVPGRGVIRYLDHLVGDGRPLFELCRQQHLEGVVSKLLQSRYETKVGARTTAWVKHKCERDDEFVVIGWVEGKGARGELGALELGSYRNSTLVYRGRVGSGFDQVTLGALLVRLRKLERDEWDVVGEPIEDGRRRHYVEPVMVVSVRYLEWTNENRLRMAVFRGVRDDIAPTSCTAVPPFEVEALLQEEDLESEPLDVAPQAPAPARRVQLSNLDKIFWREEGYTKGDLLTYYERIAGALLPHLRDRPVMLVRYPDGIDGKSFYQWNVPAGTPDWLGTLQLRDEERDGKEVSTFLIDSTDALLHVVNLGCIPIHVLASRQGSLDCCDFLCIDFDLGERPLKDGVILALSLKDLLDELGLQGFPKTSGQTGLHVFIPVGPGVPFPAAKALVELLGRLLQRQHPERSTMERRVSERGARVYIDTGQTGRSRTIVAPYSVRAYRGGRVSTPLFWEEVHLAMKPDEFTMFTVPERFSDKGDPMQELMSATPDVMCALGQLEKMLKGSG